MLQSQLQFHGEIMYELFFLLIVCLLFGVGVFLIIGTIKGIEVLVKPPVKWFSLYPYWFLKKYGDRSVYYFHIFIGIVFIIGAISILLYGILY